MPFVAAFLTMPDLLVKALFGRGAFDARAAETAATVLFAYALGLIPVLLIRSVVASFFARGDTTTPVMASLTALAINVVLKIVLVGPLSAAGLALATAIGAWINFAILYGLAIRRGWTKPSDVLARAVVVAFSGAIAFEIVVLLLRDPAQLVAGLIPREQALVAAAIIGTAAVAAYALMAVGGARLLKLDLRFPGSRKTAQSRAASAKSM
jgi:putative peptidoglycan lipid II flippase